MARKRAATGNKSQAIRDALAANPDKSPKDIAEELSAQGFKLNAQYVSTIKSNMSRKAGKQVVRRKVQGKRPPAMLDQSPILHATALIMSAGGLDQAQAVLDQVKKLRDIL
jgi:hypothetical protein